MKQSSKLLVWTSEDIATRKGFFVYRAPGPWTNPNSISMLGTDGRDGVTLVAQVEQKLGLATSPDHWREIASVENLANNEVNHVYELVYPLEGVMLNHKAYGGLMVFAPQTLWQFAGDNAPIALSPALRSIMDAMPEVFGHG